MKFLLKFIYDTVFLDDGWDCALLYLFDFLLHFFLDIFELLIVTLEFMDFEFFLLFGLKKFQHFVLLCLEFLIEFIHDFLEFLLFILIPDSIFVLLLQFIGTISLKLEFRFCLMIEW